MQKRIVPCYECDKRALGCHSTCEDYKAFNEKNKAAIGEKVEAAKKHYLASDTAFKLKVKLYKRYGRR